jgi:hypothetical protein
MAVSYNFAGPRIVADGLSFYYDIASPNCYNLSRPLILKNLAGSSINGSLNNGPIFSNNNKGVFIMDGTNDSISSTVSRVGADNTTQIIWYKWNGINQAKILFYIGSNAGTNGIGIYIGDGNCAATNYIGIFYGGISCNVTSNSADTIGTTWRMLSLTRVVGSTRLYRDTTELRNIGSNYNGTTTTFNQFLCNPGGDIGMLMFYNRALSPAEITQNFNATRGRFGV